MFRLWFEEAFLLRVCQFVPTELTAWDLYP